MDFDKLGITSILIETGEEAKTLLSECGLFDCECRHCQSGRHYDPVQDYVYVELSWSNSTIDFAINASGSSINAAMYKCGMMMLDYLRKNDPRNEDYMAIQYIKQHYMPAFYAWWAELDIVSL